VPRCRQGAFLNDDTIRTCHRLHQEDSFDGLTSFGYDGSTCRRSDTQQDKLKAWITDALPRTTGAVGVWIEKKFGITCESGLAWSHCFTGWAWASQAKSRVEQVTGRPALHPSSLRQLDQRIGVRFAIAVDSQRCGRHERQIPGFGERRPALGTVVAVKPFVNPHHLLRRTS
jgi:hypothetical protein